MIPHALRDARLHLALAALALVVASAAAQAQAPPAVVPAPAASLLQHHNAARAAANLAPLWIDSRLTAAAQKYAEWMAATGQFTHYGQGTTPWQRIAAAGYPGGATSENIGAQWGYTDPAWMHDGLMRSSGHRANILGRYRHVGVGFAAGPRGSFYCVTFGG